MTTEGSVNLPEIALGDLLTDAAQVLEQNGLNALARGTRIAASMLGGPCRGEAWVSDIMTALDAADLVVHCAIKGAENVNLGDLRDALERVRNWGLEPQERLGNAYQHIVRLAAMFIAEAELRSPVKATGVQIAVEKFVDALGFDAAGAPQESEPE